MQNDQPYPVTPAYKEGLYWLRIYTMMKMVIMIIRIITSMKNMMNMVMLYTVMLVL